MAALGVDTQGYKHVLGLREGASENAQVVKDLLADLVERGLNPQRRRLFVIDGSKALRAGIHEVFGCSTPIQRCRIHKVRNVLGYLPDERQADVEAAMKAAFKLKAEEGMAKIEKLAQWLEREYPSAAGSLREGLAELFTINRLGLPKTATPLFGFDECDRVSVFGGASEDRACQAVAGWADGLTLDGVGVAVD
jgi:transposase-like protein